MYTERCSLCYAFTRNGAIEHLERDHRRTNAEACVLVERSKEGTLGWNAQNSRQKVRSSLPSGKMALSCANPTSRLSGCLFHRLSAISDSGNRPGGDTRQPVQSQ
jgi:hypothetical protein